ncbi:MAG: hypothetical protein ACREA0_24405 [bacterium]
MSLRRTGFGVAAAVLGATASIGLGDGQVSDRATLNSILGGSQILEDFESFVIGDGTATVLDANPIDENSIANGQGPGLVEDGASYGSSTVLQWNGNNYYGLQSRTFLANSVALQINYDTPVRAMGLDARGFVGYGFSGRMDVYDSNNTLAGTINFTINNGGSESVFLGWEIAAGISRVTLDDLNPNHSWSPVIDDHGYGVSGGGFIIRLTGQCPGPKTLSWSGAGSGQMGIIIGNGPGNFTLPSGPCAGTQLGLSGPSGLSLYNVIGTQGGQGQVTTTVGTQACGKWIQCIKTNDCSTSNAAGPI